MGSANLYAPQKIIDMRRAYAGFFSPYDHIYNPLLDDFETGMKTKDILEIFGELRPQQAALLKRIAASPQVEDAFLHQPFDEKKQWNFGLENVDLMTFYKGINKVQPSLIRVEADEATYNLHIMLRLDLEIALMEGTLQAKDLPEAWNAHMQEYLGLTPPNNTSGMLQDVHWASGMIGYFTTYTLGNLISAQLWECILDDLPDVAQQIELGEFGDLIGWLRDKIHRHGAKFDPKELAQRVTGSKISSAPYLHYLEHKFGEIYKL